MPPTVSILAPPNRINPMQSAPTIPYDYPAASYSNTNYTSAPSYVPNVIYVNPLPDDQIDSALLSAISNPRERMVLFHIENTILEFVKSNERSMDFQPGYNSFRRLLAYRVGQRFGLSHSTADTNAENGERSITLFKTTTTLIPKTLLIDLNIPADANFNDDSDPTNLYLPSNPVPLESLLPAATSNNLSAPKKFLLMKRTVLKTTSESAKVAAVKQQQSEEDKEKAYNEARARIFGEEPSPALETTAASVEQPSVSHTPVASAEKSELKAPTNTASTSKATSSAKDAAANKPAVTASGTSASKSQSAKNSSGSLQTVIHKSASNASLDLPANSNSNSSVRKAASVPSLASDSTALQIVQSKSAKASQRAATSSPAPPDKASTTNSNSTSSKSRSNGNSPVDLSSSSSSSNGGKSAKVAAAPSSNGLPHSGLSSSSIALFDGSNSSKSSGHSKKKSVDAGSWKGNKSQVRDVDAERSDPDFVRRSSPGLLAVNAAQMQQQQLQLQQQQMYGGRPMMGMGQEAVGVLYMQSSANSAGYLSMLPSPPNPSVAAAGQPGMYLPPQMDPGSHMMFTAAAPMSHQYSTGMLAGNSSNASSGGEYTAQQAPQNGMLLAPTLPVFYSQQTNSAWPAPQQHAQQQGQQQHALNMMQPVYYQPSSGDMQQQQHHQYVQQQMYQQQQQSYPAAPYYDYSQPSQYYSQQQGAHAMMPQQTDSQQTNASSQQQDHDPSPQRSRKGSSTNRTAEPPRSINSFEFPPLK
eukprot:CAMPEP_0170085436 /NCGR_PEP_ID=MMETSP0019_2-20121128/20311_1 /TAXON_ID=98059 /ORGANISM="Dinobryon sp., Strain UTEXLB2267" /LENGTH=754 /DNA_ID=CAMNT_0010301879 /DNA_START=9 /DNA_END=2273 /DNA_ORIENTATION=+